LEVSRDVRYGNIFLFWVTSSGTSVMIKVILWSL